MASEPIFRIFLAGKEVGREDKTVICDVDQFVQKQYPMLHMNISAGEHPSIKSLQYGTERSNCLLCKRLDKNTLDSIRVLETHEVRAYLKFSGRHVFTERQVNLHLAHSSTEGTVVGMLQNMSVDLISGSYALASQASLWVMNRVHTHMGRVFLVPDPSVAKVHNNAVKQFIGLAATCQALMKHKQSEQSKGASETSQSQSLL